MNIVITGTSSGIGLACYQHLAAREHAVWGLARRPTPAGPTLPTDRLRSSLCDVSDWPAVARAANEVAAVWPRVDALVACAGIQGEMGRTLEADPAHWAQTVQANLIGTFFTLRAFAPLLARADRRAKIVCFSGGGATKARANFSAYGTAKTGIVRLVETIAEEEREARLDINALAPGAINTRLTDEVLAKGPGVVGRAEYEAAVKQKESGGASLSTALAAVEWLLGPESDGISGRLISAPWDPWKKLSARASELQGDVYTLRRIVPEDRGLKW